MVTSLTNKMTGEKRDAVAWLVLTQLTHGAAEGERRGAVRRDRRV